MKVKICGLRVPENIQEVSSIKVDFIGLNFYHKSKRLIDHRQAFRLSTFNKIPKVGVFVNARLRYLLDMVKVYGLSYVQLHGDESPEYVSKASQEVKVIKVFPIESKDDFKKISEYQNCDYFLFDTKSEMKGGTGIKFDWKLLLNYTGTTPFFLAGGISMSDLKEIQNINHPKLYGLDLNSQFETEPGMKNAKLIQEFISLLRNHG